ncbi:hypothetical protein, partial [Ostreibacterium oceani]|uniref:hypothetical protein n=1 Tax=Ostreibacterium oceani TaxID=2654998 RepID=UPI001C4081AD
DRDGFCNLKKDEVWDKLHSSYEEYINYVTKNKKPLKEYPNCIYHYMKTVNRSNIFNHGKDDFLRKASNKELGDVIKFRSGRKPSKKIRQHNILNRRKPPPI